MDSGVEFGDTSYVLGVLCVGPRRYAMCRLSKLPVTVMILVLVAFAQTQVATITSDSPFQLRGADVTPGQGVPSWPVMPGDAIQAGETPLTITFQDGSTVVLAPGSSAKVDLSGKTPVFQLENGSAHYSLKSTNAVKLMELKTLVMPSYLAGDLQTSNGSSKLASGWWTTGHTIAVIGGSAGAAGLAVGVVQAAKVSKSNCPANN